MYKKLADKYNDDKYNDDKYNDDKYNDDIKDKNIIYIFNKIIY